VSVKSGPTSAQYVFATMSPPLQCFFLMIFDTVHGGMKPAATMSLGAMRAVALTWTLAYGLASLGLYLSSLRIAVRTDLRGT